MFFTVVELNTGEIVLLGVTMVELAFIIIEREWNVECNIVSKTTVNNGQYGIDNCDVVVLTETIDVLEKVLKE